MSDKTLNVVFQTHWDREWYYSFEAYRYRLIQVMERIVEAILNQEIDCFVLDGQVAALEDYYEVASEEMCSKVKQLVAESKIIIGPWYVLADEFLVSGESLIRNLEIGMNIANKNGNCQKIGYLPDTFGHVSQIPQILKGFNIEDAIIWRGIVSKTSELLWQSPDDSSVFTLFLSEGYYQPIIDQPKHIENMSNFIDKVSQFALTDQLLLTNGGDHLMPANVNLKERFEELSQHYPNVKFRSTSFTDHINQVKTRIDENKLDIYKGELRDNRHIYVLPNVLSTRSYLKVENQLLEDQILGYTEPLIALTYQKDDQEPKRYLDETWKLIMQNHPHDSICGCSVDEVHKEMQVRTLKVKQRLDVLEKGALQHKKYVDYTLYGNANKAIFEDLSSFTVFNPHPQTYTGEVFLTVYIREDQADLEKFTLIDQDGVMYQPVVLKKYKGKSFESPTDYFPEFRKETFYDLVISVKEFESLSLKEFKVVSGDYELLHENLTPVIENEYIKIEVVDQNIQLTDKLTNEVYQDVNHFYSSLDQGDEYNYSKPLNDVVTLNYQMLNIKARQSSLVQVLSYDVVLLLPLQLSSDRQSGCKELVPTTISVELTITKQSNEVKSKVTIHNQAKDHRLRVTFNTQTLLEKTFSDSAFSIEERNVRDEVFECARGYGKEVPVVVEPSLSFIYAGCEKGIVFNHRGLHEYQMVNKDAQTTLEVTLLRSVSHLSRDDMRSRGGGAGPGFETPDAQCLGTYTFNYSFAPINKDKSMGSYLTDAHFFRNPLKLYKAKLNGEVVKSMIHIDNNEVQWSSLRKIDKKIYLRVWNPYNRELNFNLTSLFNYKSITEVKLNFEEINKISEHVVLNPHQIMTICFDLV